MEFQSLPKIVKLASVVSVFSLMVAAHTFASEEVQQPETQAKNEQTSEELAEELRKEIEVLEVVGGRPLLYYRNKFKLAEMEFYDLFNEVADKEEFKVVCRDEAQVGSRVKRTNCYPQYLLTRTSSETQFAIRTGAPAPTISEMENLLEQEKAEFVKYSEDLVNQHPQLLAKLVEFGAAKKVYEEKKAEK